MSNNQEWKEKKVGLGGAIVVSAITLFIGVFIGIKWNSFAPYLGITKNTSYDWSALDEVYSSVKSHYDGEIDHDKIIEGAKKGLVEALGDDYTVYMSAEETQELNDYLHGNVGAGIGVEMGLRDGYVRVIRTLPDNPARKAGILAGDIFYKVDGEDVYDLSTDEIANKVRGEEGSEVTVTVIRDGEELSFTMKRETINNVSAYVDYRGDTAIVTLTRFDTDTGTIVQKFAQEFASKGVKKVILDLRGNGGGYVSAAKDLLSLWIDGELIFTQKSAVAATENTYAYRNKAILKDMPTVVLINGTSASASEIVAGALKDYNKATVVGETSFGKGVVQTLFDLSDNTSLKVTTAHWYTPKGNCIHGEGITPDQEVELTYEDTNLGRDPQLDAALAL